MIGAMLTAKNEIDLISLQLHCRNSITYRRLNKIMGRRDVRSLLLHMLRNTHYVATGVAAKELPLVAVDVFSQELALVDSGVFWPTGPAFHASWLLLSAQMTAATVPACAASSSKVEIDAHGWSSDLAKKRYYC